MSGFDHVASNGIVVKSASLDLSTGVEVHVPTDASSLDIARAVAQAFGYHGAVLHPDLPSFSGYDTVRLRIVVQPMMRIQS